MMLMTVDDCYFGFLSGVFSASRVTQVKLTVHGEWSVRDFKVVGDSGDVQINSLNFVVT